MHEIVTTASGKLMLAGEWAVLEVGNPCIVLGLDFGITVRVRPSKMIMIDAPDVGLSIRADYEKNEQKEFLFAKAAIEVVHQFLHGQGQLPPFHLLITSALPDTRADDTCADDTRAVDRRADDRRADDLLGKSGLGASAATVVAVVRGLLRFFQYDESALDEDELVFKLSAIAHYRAQGMAGSCFDVAAATYGSMLLYKRFDPVWFEKQVAVSSLDNLPRDMVAAVWPELVIRPLAWPKGMRVLVGCVGKSASTTKLMAQMAVFKKENEKVYKEIIAAIAGVVEQLVVAIEGNDREAIIRLIKKNRELLTTLSERSGVALQTPELEELCTIAERYGAGAKFSGAGGGDCGIAVCFDQTTEQRHACQQIRTAWQAAGIRLYPIVVGKTA